MDCSYISLAFFNPSLISRLFASINSPTIAFNKKNLSNLLLIINLTLQINFTLIGEGVDVLFLASCRHYTLLIILILSLLHHKII